MKPVSRGFICLAFACTFSCSCEGPAPAPTRAPDAPKAPASPPAAPEAPRAERPALPPQPPAPPETPRAVPPAPPSPDATPEPAAAKPAVPPAPPEPAAAPAPPAAPRDTTPPAIAIEGVVDGGQYAPGIAVVVRVEDDNLDGDRTSITLNDTPYTSGEPIVADNSYMLIVKAFDRAGNRAAKRVRFVVSGN